MSFLRHEQPAPAPLPLLNADEYAALAGLSSCAVANAIEGFNVQLRNEGFTAGYLACRFPELPPVLGYAFTLQVRTSAPPMKGRTFLENIEWWERLLAVPEPRIVVIQDIDRQPGSGAVVGALLAEILKKLGCVGVLTNGAVRELPQIAPLLFQLYSSTLTASHSYCHIVRVGEPVQIEGLEVKTGDLLHGDVHGMVRVPRELATRIPKTAEALREKEAALEEYLRSPDFSVEGLRARLNPSRS
jgi:4-hydroxy-4-methyl-2-oxoglutarate aldolase